MPQLRDLPNGLTGQAGEERTPFTGSQAYICLHGRNAGAWYCHDDSPNGSSRYDYEYSPAELHKFVPVIKAAIVEGKWSYLSLDLESGQLLFSIILNAYERLSLIITTNLPFNEWGPMFADEQLAAAIIDRIVHYGYLIKTGNKDWRLEHALLNDR